MLFLICEFGVLEMWVGGVNSGNIDCFRLEVESEVFIEVFGDY